MIRKFSLAALALLAALSINAQVTIQGKLLDKNNNGPIEMATVRLLRAQDSALVNGVVTDFAGRYELPKVAKGNYLLEYKFLGYKTQVQPLSVDNKPQILKNVYLEEDVLTLEAAEISGTAAQMIVRGDTVEYNAAAFKLQEDAVVEDLFKRLPGFTVDSDGNITVNGETIERIRVDGKKFFDGDNEMVTKNFTADMIDKVQVIDEKSEMAQLTGVEDGETKRIINLVLKPDRRKGTFGNLGGGLGADYDKGFADYRSSDYRSSVYRADDYATWMDKFLAEDARYNANTTINFFSPEHKTTLTAGANNTNTSRSSRGRGNRGWSGGSGITSTQNLGLNDSRTYRNDSLELSGHVTYNHSTNEGRSSTKRDSWLRDVTSQDTSFSTSHSVSNNASLSYELRWKLDTLNTLVVQPSLNYGFNSTESARTFEYYTNGDTTSWGNSSNTNQSRNVDGRLNVLFSHRSGHRKGRTLTANVSGSLSNSKGEGINISNKYMPNDSSLLKNQKSYNRSTSYSYSVRGSWVEPLWNNKNYVELNASASVSDRYSRRDQYDFDADVLDYTLLDSEYSNEFWSDSYRETVSLNYNYRGTGVNLTAGFTGEPSQTRSYTLYGNGEVRDIPNNVFNYSPSLNLRYNIGGNRREYVRVEYRGRSTEPTVTQMQPVKNNTNVMRETVGNPNLLPSFAHTLRLQYSKSNAETLASFNTSLNATLTQNAMVSNSIYDASGKQYNQTVNAESDPFSLNGSIMYNRPIIKNLLHLNTNTSASYQQRIGYSSRNVALENISSDDVVSGRLMLGDKSVTDNYSVSENLSLTLTQDIVEVGARGQFRYSNTLNNLNTGNDRSTINWSASGNVTFHLPYSINIDNNLSYNARQGYAGFDKNELLWNASVNMPVFKKKFTLQLSAYDVLRQRLNINQSIGDNSVTYTQTDMLTSYFLMTLTYKVRRFGNRSGNRSMGERPSGGFSGGRGQMGRGGESGSEMPSGNGGSSDSGSFSSGGSGNGGGMGGFSGGGMGGN